MSTAVQIFSRFPNQFHLQSRVQYEAGVEHLTF